MSKLFSGVGNHNYKKPLPEWQKEINRKVQMGRIKSQEEKDKIYPKIRKKIINLNTGEVYESVKYTAALYNCSGQTITRKVKSGKFNLKFI
jgi:hypothetical protein